MEIYMKWFILNWWLKKCVIDNFTLRDFHNKGPVAFVPIVPVAPPSVNILNTAGMNSISHLTQGREHGAV